MLTQPFKLQSFYTRLFLAQLFFMCVLFTTPQSVRALGSHDKFRERVMFEGKYQWDATDLNDVLELDEGVRWEDLPVYSKTIRWY